jgi:hypothetical protein
MVWIGKEVVRAFSKILSYPGRNEGTLGHLIEMIWLFLFQLLVWFQTANECMVLKLLSEGPLGTLLAFTGLGRVLSSLHGALSTQVIVAQLS